MATDEVGRRLFFAGSGRRGKGLETTSGSDFSPPFAARSASAVRFTCGRDSNPATARRVLRAASGNPKAVRGWSEPTRPLQPEQALKTIDCDERAHVREVDDRKTRRWQVLIVVVVVLAIVAGMVMIFLSRGESERAMQLFESGAKILLGLLGGVGLAKSGLFSDAKSGSRDED
jgi:hypothetical protein